MSDERSEDDDVNGLGCGCLLRPGGTAIRRLCKWHEATTFPKTWAGFRAFLDEMYPDDIFPDKGRDLGPSFVVAARRLSEVESEVRSLRGVVQAVRELADEWERKAGPESSGWQVYGPQWTSVPFVVKKLREIVAAAADAPQPEPCPNCGHREPHASRRGECPICGCDAPGPSPAVLTPTIEGVEMTTGTEHQLIVSGTYARCSCGVEFFFPDHAQQYGDHRAAVASGGPVAPVGSPPASIRGNAGGQR